MKRSAVRFRSAPPVSVPIKTEGRWRPKIHGSVLADLWPRSSSELTRLLYAQSLPSRTNPLAFLLLVGQLHVTSARTVMASTSVAKPSKLRVSAHRARLRAQGLRPIQIWVPDVRTPSFKAQAHAQSLAVAASLQAHQDQDFIDAISDWGDE